MAELRRDIQTIIDAQAAGAAREETPAKAPSHKSLDMGGYGALRTPGRRDGALPSDGRGAGDKTVVFVSPAIEPEQRQEMDTGPSELLPSRVSADGRTMTLILADRPADKFYSDPSLATFHHYVEFLNEVADDLTVEQDLVKRKDMILIYIGDGSAPEDQIIHQNGRFRLRNAEWAAKPVVRVTWLGARAYANYYGKRLPTFDEWF